MAARRRAGARSIFSAQHESWRDHPRLNDPFGIYRTSFLYAVAIFSTYQLVEFGYKKLAPPPAPTQPKRGAKYVQIIPKDSE